MVGFMDVAPLGKSVSVAGQNVIFHGVTLEHLAFLFGLFPELKSLIEGDKSALTVEFLFKTAPRAVAFIIACGSGAPVDDKIEAVAAHAARFPMETQYDCIAAIVEMTMPGGVGPFMDRVNSVSALTSGFAEGIQQQKDSAMNSPQQPNGSLSGDMRHTDTHPAK